MSTMIPLPRLETLATKPSWHNRAGRVDRSACFTLTASQHWRNIPEDDWHYRLGKPPHNTRGPSRSQPPCAAQRLRGKCDRYASIGFWARDLWLLHKLQQPYPLQGDFRSAKSNAMRSHIPRNKSPHPAQAQRNDPVLGIGPINPNRGVGFNLYKRLGLDCLWQTTLRIERYILHATLSKHFLVCPVCGDQNKTAASHAGAQPPTAPGRGPAVFKRPQLPAGRVSKLYLPLTTPREYEDAQLAQLWLNTHTHPNRPLHDNAAALIARYGELFAPRQLRCRQCLGLRYGEAKAKQSTKRKRVPHTFNQSGALAHASCSDKPSAPITTRRPTEQTLFLQNLPKLLKKPTSGNALPGMPMGENKSEALTEGEKEINPSAIINDQSNTAQLLADLCQLLPSFNRLAKFKKLAK